MTVLSIMDRDGWDQNTDNIIIADSVRKTLTWVPRGLWCDRFKDKDGRICTVFANYGHVGLLKCLEDYKLRCRQSICLLPLAFADIVDNMDIEVPVDRPMRFRYALVRQAAYKLVDGHLEGEYRVITFNPPSERLRGERIHEWCGARFGDGEERYSDLDRIARQQVLVRQLIDAKFLLGPLNPDGLSAYATDFWGDFKHVTSEWALKTFGPLKQTVIDRKCCSVLA